MNETERLPAQSRVIWPRGAKKGAAKFEKSSLVSINVVLGQEIECRYPMFQNQNIEWVVSN